VSLLVPTDLDAGCLAVAGFLPSQAELIPTEPAPADVTQWTPLQ